MAKKHKSVRAAQEAGSMYFYDKNGTKKLAVTAEQLNAWKKKNKGKYKGSALTAWAKNKGKDVGETGVTKSLRPKLRPKKKEAPKKKDSISDEQRSRQTTTPKRALNNSAMSPAQQVEKLLKDKADKRAAIQKGREEADKILADTSTGAGSGPSTRPNNRPKGPKAEQKRRADRKSRMPDELSNAPMNSSKGRTMSDLEAEAMLRRGVNDIYLGSDDDEFGNKKDRRVTGVRPPSQAQKAFSTSLRDAKMNKGGMTKKSGYMGGGMTKKKVMTYNIGGMVKSQVNNLKKGKG
jgi:hypothetical protein